MMKSGKKLAPIIFEFMDYRAFVTVSIEYLKIHRKFSARQFANRSGFKSPSYLVISEKV